jgi:PhnB protein
MADSVRPDWQDKVMHGEGGSVTMPLEETFWAARFGMVVDRFGIPWLINCEGAGSPQVS